MVEKQLISVENNTRTKDQLNERELVDLIEAIDRLARFSDVLSQVETDRFARCTVHLMKALNELRR